MKSILTSRNLISGLAAILLLALCCVQPSVRAHGPDAESTIVRATPTGANPASAYSEEPKRNWEDIIIDVMTGTGPTFPSKYRPSRTKAVSANAVRAFQQRDDVKGISAARFGSPQWDKGAWLEYSAKKKDVILVPMKSSASRADAFPRRDVSYALFILHRGSETALSVNNSCVSIVAVNTTQTSASAKIQRSVTFLNVNGTPFAKGKQQGNGLVFERIGKNNLFASKPCPQASDGGLLDCVFDTDIPDILEPQCALHFALCTTVIVANCIDW